MHETKAIVGTMALLSSWVLNQLKDAKRADGQENDSSVSNKSATGKYGFSWKPADP